MTEEFDVDLTPMYGDKIADNVLTKIYLEQDYVHITANGKRRLWGYVSTREGHGQFLPLSGFPKELVPAVQEKINAIRFPDGGGPAAKSMERSGATAQEQEEGDDE